MDSQETKAITTNEPENTTKNELEERQTSTDEGKQKTDEPKAAENIQDFAKKAINKEIGSQFATENHGHVGVQNVFNIYEMKGDISSVKKEAVNDDTSDDEPYKLNERKACSAFVKEYQVSMHLAYAIAASVYEYVPVSDLPFLSRSLLRRFDSLPYRDREYDKNGNEIFKHRSELISVDDISNIIGTKPLKVTFTTRFEDITEKCIGFEELRESVRENLWGAFPGVRSAITSWLIETDFSHTYRNALSTTCLVQAVYNIVKMDFGDAMSTLFQQLVSNKKNKYLMMRLMLLLVEDETTKKNACEILRQWSTSPNWLWEVSLVVFSLSKEELPFANELERVISLKFINDFDEDWGGWSMYFIAGQMMDSARLRNLVSRALHKLASGEGRKKNEQMVAAIYLVAIFNAYQFVNKDSMALSLIAVDNKKQLENIEVLLYKIFSDFNMRHGLFDVLEAYLEELDGYETTERLRNQLKSYFYVIAKKSERYNGDAQRFLSRLQKKGCKISKEILAFLQEKLPSKKELIKHGTTNNQ